MANLVILVDALHPHPTTALRATSRCLHRRTHEWFMMKWSQYPKVNIPLSPLQLTPFAKGKDWIDRNTLSCLCCWSIGNLSEMITLPFDRLNWVLLQTTYVVFLVESGMWHDECNSWKLSHRWSMFIRWSVDFESKSSCSLRLDQDQISSSEHRRYPRNSSRNWSRCWCWLWKEVNRSSIVEMNEWMNELVWRSMRMKLFKVCQSRMKP